mmetsp:Transcript_18508/g.27494  ORF Transcript_18508/g.27494 Transcript_18508/m.27494 type:complete len:112 (-) Transcript_18508:13-348(-)
MTTNCGMGDREEAASVLAPKNHLAKIRGHRRRKHLETILTGSAIGLAIEWQARFSMLFGLKLDIILGESFSQRPILCVVFGHHTVLAQYHGTGYSNRMNRSVTRGATSMDV